MNQQFRASSANLMPIADLLRQLCAVAKEHQIYGPEHPRTIQSTARYIESCADVRQLSGVGDALLVSHQNDRFFLENMPLPLRPSDAQLLRQQLCGTQRLGFQLAIDLTGAQLVPVLELLTQVPGTEGADAEPPHGFRWLSDSAVHRLGNQEHSGRRRHMIMNLQGLPIDETVYLNAMSSLEQFMEDCSGDDSGDLASVSKASDNLVGQMTQMQDRILPLTTIPYDHNFTYYHSLNVALLTLSAARLVVQDEEHLRRIGRAAMMHDIGKVDVPKEILHKPGRLTETEADLVMRHPVTGARRLANHPDSDMLSVAVAFGHHIKDNDQGYPKVGPGYRMGAITSLLEVADIFEALTANRPYKKALSAAQAFEVLYSMPNMVSFRPYMDLLVRAIGFNPVGSRVRTADGEVAVVVGHADNNPRAPIIRTLSHDRDQEFHLSEERVARSLSDTDEVDEASVVALDPDEDHHLSVA